MAETAVSQRAGRTRQTPAATGTRVSPRATPRLSPIPRLTRAVGNSAMNRLLRGAIQPQLTVGPADDKYEREADRVADEVMRMPDPMQHAPSAVQRKCDRCKASDDHNSAALRRYGMAKAVSGRRCESAPSQSAEDEQQERTLQRSTISVGSSSRSTIQRYSLKGFPPAKAGAMRGAISTAVSKVKSCPKASWWDKWVVPPAINTKRYDYVEDLGLCGWTFPASWYIEIGKDAFDPNKCCDLASTIAHEASHTEFFTEGGARDLECDCFGCSC